jgi:hypothetical protein
VKLRIEKCACGNAIIETIPEIIFEYGIPPLLRNSSYKKRKGARGNKNRSLLSLCQNCREKHSSEVFVQCKKRAKAGFSGREPRSIAENI